MKILSRKNGVALIAVLTVLLVLTLLLPVMFKTSENATYSAATELNRQRASYLARTGVEMTVAAVKGTRDSEDLAYKKLYEALKNKDESHSAIKIKSTKLDGVDVTLAYTEIEPIWMFLDSSGESKYVSGPEGSDKVLEYMNSPAYSFVGKTETTVTYNGEPQYYKVNADNTRTQIDKRAAFEDNGEIKADCVAIYNDSIVVESKSLVNGQRAVRKAIIVRNYDTSNVDGEALVAYTTRNSATAPDFLNVIEGKTRADEAEYGFGFNQAFANPFKANSKLKVNAVKDFYVESGSNADTNKYIYVFSTIGNMIIDADREMAENGRDVVALGTFPGVKYRATSAQADSDEGLTAACDAELFSSVNYISYADNVQRYNFMSFTATNVAQVRLPIDLRVTPARAGRAGDAKVELENLLPWMDGNVVTERNASLFKMINIQAKDIAFEQRIDLMMSLYEARGNIDAKQETAYRGGFLLLSAPATTPYSYHHAQLNEMVPAGMVYFTEPVYLWLIENGNKGSSSLNANGTNIPLLSDWGETMYRFSQVGRTTSFTGPLNRYDNQDIKVYKLVNAGDVYYFNANKTAKDENDGNKEVPVGFNIVNWFIETKYLATNEYEGQGWWTHFKNLREVLYKDYMLEQVKGNSEISYYPDDFHYIGNMNEQHTLISPSVLDDDYVIWSN